MAGDGPLPSQGYVGFSALGLVSRSGGAVRRTRPPAASALCLSATQGPGAGKARQGVDGGIALPRLSGAVDCRFGCAAGGRSEEHTSELQSLIRSSYAVFSLKTKKQNRITNNIHILTKQYIITRPFT